ncbi:MAG: hypothetical protein EZS28_048155 [Streblomastix strix]|uniref:Uncharacterized protein n=1 Tax=Streblomastix strix TaxID=222440 RepID=A0A5J4TDJ9_9EUKA|nr:MAG: hypothetical protein EZS28_048155 [Streblomastix strix]
MLIVRYGIERTKDLIRECQPNNHQQQYQHKYKLHLKFIKSLEQFQWRRLVLLGVKYFGLELIFGQIDPFVLINSNEAESDIQKGKQIDYKIMDDIIIQLLPFVGRDAFKGIIQELFLRCVDRSIWALTQLDLRGELDSQDALIAHWEGIPRRVVCLTDSQTYDQTAYVPCSIVQFCSTDVFLRTIDL